MEKVMDDWIDEKQGDRIAAELEARQEAFDARVKNLMFDHEIFAEFMRYSVGDEWISDILDGLVAGANVWSSKEMAYAYQEFCETLVKERG